MNKESSTVITSEDTSLAVLLILKTNYEKLKKARTFQCITILDEYILSAYNYWQSLKIRFIAER